MIDNQAPLLDASLITRIYLSLASLRNLVVNRNSILIALFIYDTDNIKQ